jgi:hypothetical protein
VINIANVPANIAKKYKRALNANRRELRRIDEEWDGEYRKHPMIEHNVMNMDGSPKVYSCEKLVPHNLKMLRLLKERIPIHKSKVIVDLPFNFRDNYGKWSFDTQKVLKSAEMIIYINKYLSANMSSSSF